VDKADKAETGIVRDANEALRRGGIRYGVHYVDDYRTVSSSGVTPGRAANILGDLATRKTVSRTPTAFDIYRLGARIVAGQ
jgi:hypothetical protein